MRKVGRVPKLEGYPNNDFQISLTSDLKPALLPAFGLYCERVVQDYLFVFKFKILIIDFLFKAIKFCKTFLSVSP